MTLREDQVAFVWALAQLITEAHRLGYELTLGEAERPAWVAAIYAVQGKGIRNSFHTKRLAIDLNVFRNGVYLTGADDYRDLGAYWVFLGGTWGGNFTRQDANHFSWKE